MATPHNAAELGDIASTVLMPGDPLRAQYIAEKFLTDVRQVTGVRNMLGFTGLWKGNLVSVMGSGMGGPSCGLYAYELYDVYGVELIIRIGTCGGLQKFLQIGDLVLAVTASTDSNYAYQYKLPGTYSPCADFELLGKAAGIAHRYGFRYAGGGVFSSDMFSSYNALGARESWEPWARMGCVAQDMETYAIDDVSLDIGKGEFVSIMGQSGCGKSTLLNIAGLLDEPTEGKIVLDGQNVEDLDDKGKAFIRNRKIGFIFQSFHLISSLNIIDNVMLPLTFRDDISHSKAREKAESLLETVGLAHRMHHFPAQLSGGQCQRAAIARALVTDPEIILADEPTGNLDSRNSTEIMELLKKLNSSGKTILMVTHSDEIARYTGRTVTMADGHLSDSIKTASL